MVYAKDACGNQVELYIDNTSYLWVIPPLSSSWQQAQTWNCVTCILATKYYSVSWFWSDQFPFISKFNCMFHSYKIDDLMKMWKDVSECAKSANTINCFTSFFHHKFFLQSTKQPFVISHTTKEGDKRKDFQIHEAQNPK